MEAHETAKRRLSVVHSFRFVRFEVATVRAGPSLTPSRVVTYHASCSITSGMCEPSSSASAATKDDSQTRLCSGSIVQEKCVAKRHRSILCYRDSAVKYTLDVLMHLACCTSNCRLLSDMEPWLDRGVGIPPCVQGCCGPPPTKIR